MRYKLSNPPKAGARVMLNYGGGQGPFTVRSFKGYAIRFSDRKHEWFLYDTEENSGCRDATADELRAG